MVKLKDKEKVVNVENLENAFSNPFKYGITKIRNGMRSLSAEQYSTLLLDSNEFIQNSLLYYYQVFHDDSSITEKLNDPDFKVLALEKIILAIYMQKATNAVSFGPVFTKYFSQLDQKTISRLLTNSTKINGDIVIYLWVLHGLEWLDLEKEFDSQSMEQSEQFINQIWQFVQKSSEEELNSLIFCNPVLTGIIKLLMEITLSMTINAEEKPKLDIFLKKCDDVAKVSNLLDYIKDKEKTLLIKSKERTIVDNSILSTIYEQWKTIINKKNFENIVKTEVDSLICKVLLYYLNNKLPSR